MKLSAVDPRCKIVIMACLSTLAMIFTNPLFLLAILACTWMILLVGHAQPGGAIRQIKGVFWIIISLFVLQCLFTRSGEPLLVIGGFPLIMSGGFSLAIMLTLRLLILVFSALIMLEGEVRDYLLALVQWHVPYEIAFMTMASIHFLPILREEGLNVFYAVQLRGTELKKTSFKEKMRLYLKICLPIMAGALQRTQTMALAMEARAFRAYRTRTYMRHLTLKNYDKAILIIFPACSVLVVMLWSIFA